MGTGSCFPGDKAVGAVKPITHHHLLPRSRMVKLCFDSFKHLHGVALNKLSTGTTLPIQLLLLILKYCYPYVVRMLRRPKEEQWKVLNCSEDSVTYCPPRCVWWSLFIFCEDCGYRNARCFVSRWLLCSSDLSQRVHECMLCDFVRGCISFRLPWD
jgi:hypothetical protein